MVLLNNIQENQQSFIVNKKNEEMQILLKELEEEVSTRRLAEKKAEQLANIDTLTIRDIKIIYKRAIKKIQ